MKRNDFTQIIGVIYLAIKVIFLFTSFVAAQLSGHSLFPTILSVVSIQSKPQIDRSVSCMPPASSRSTLAFRRSMNSLTPSNCKNDFFVILLFSKRSRDNDFDSKIARSTMESLLLFARITCKLSQFPNSAGRSSKEL